MSSTKHSLKRKEKRALNPIGIQAWSDGRLWSTNSRPKSFLFSREKHKSVYNDPESMTYNQSSSFVYDYAGVIKTKYLLAAQSQYKTYWSDKLQYRALQKSGLLMEDNLYVAHAPQEVVLAYDTILELE